MDKNTLIAIGLSAAILIVWNVLFPPPPPQQAPEPSVEEQTTVSRSKETVEESESMGETLPSTISDVPKVSTSMLSRDIEVETANYVMVFDTRGGQAKSFQLKQYDHTKPRLTLSTWFPFLETILGPDFSETDGTANQVEMFGGQLEDLQPFKIEFEDFPKANQLLAKTVFSSDQEEIILLEQGETAFLKLTSQVVEGLQLIKTLRFESDSYLIGYKVEVINRSGRHNLSRFVIILANRGLPTPSVFSRLPTKARFISWMKVSRQSVPRMSVRKNGMFPGTCSGLESRINIS